MSLLGFIRSIFSKPREHVLAIERARSVFVETYGKSDHPGLAKVIATLDEQTVVRLCYGHIKPPGRAFYSVGTSGDVNELSFEDAKQYGERPWK